MGLIKSTSDMALQSKIIVGLSPVLLSGSVSGSYIKLQENTFYERCMISLSVANAAMGVTGADVTLKQATDVDGSGEKALDFDAMYVNLAADLKDALVSTAVVSNTFGLPTTGSAKMLYIIEVTAATLDQANGFACFRIDLDSGVGATVSVLYQLWPPITDNKLPSALVD